MTESQLTYGLEWAFRKNKRACLLPQIEELPYNERIILRTGMVEARLPSVTSRKAYGTLR